MPEVGPVEHHDGIRRIVQEHQAHGSPGGRVRGLDPFLQHHADKTAIAELRHKETLKEKNVTQDLYLLFHLMGDLHQPLAAIRQLAHQLERIIDDAQRVEMIERLVKNGPAAADRCVGLHRGAAGAPDCGHRGIGCCGIWP